jgi:hypothetical protein
VSSKKLTAVAAICIVSAIASGAAQAATITSAQFTRQADQICARDYKAQAALGPGLLNADLVSRGAHLTRAGAYLTKIVAITTTEATSFAALPTTTTGMPQRRALVAGLRTALADERAAAAAARKGDLASFTTAFDRLILHGYPTGPDYRTLIRTEKATARLFPFKTCGKGSAIYP